MQNEIVKSEKLEQLLQANWTEFIDHVRLLHMVFEHVRDTEFRSIRQQQIPPRQTKITLTNLKIKDDQSFEVWVEYSIPREAGIVIGTNIYTLRLSGEIQLNESFGTHFMPET